MADHAGIFAALAMGALVAGAVHGLQRIRTRGRRAAASAMSVGPGESARSGPQTRLRVGFLHGALVFLVVAVALGVVVPWATAARELGARGLLSFALWVVPLAIGLAHAARRSRLEW